MITDRNKLNFVTIQWFWLLCLIVAALNSSKTWIHYAEAAQAQQQSQQQHLKATLQLQQEVKSNGSQNNKQQDVTVRNFSPRMDYNNNEWRPVGRGDPLKNDPTFDYSPPTLDRVRYWADSEKDKEKTEEVSAALIDAKLKKANPGKNEILLLGVTSDRMRGGAPMKQHASNIVKNAKGETPLLQPKYTSIRRSYYAHHLPTHLMPPPMQPMLPASQQHQLQSSQMQQQSQQQEQAMHIVKPVHTEYRHNFPSQSYMTSSPMSSMNVHAKPYYMSTATQTWMRTSSSPSTGTSSSSSSYGHSPIMMSGDLHRYSHPHAHAIDSHHQESVNYLSYHNRPSLTSTPSIMLGVSGAMGHHEMFSPNSKRVSSSGYKSTTTSSKKPWIHDLLQKEFTKSVKTTQNPNSFNFEPMKSSHMMSQHFEPITRPQGSSPTYAPVTFVTPTMPSTTSTTQTVYVTSSTQKEKTSTSQSPMYSSTPPTLTTYAPRTTTTLSPTRLLIPNTSNLAYRPTVAPLKMTTDSLFSHYNQPEKPLRGPMYLIIEGHSKVKTYGKDELDPHKPKIVPVIPKREPVVRVADPNEKRGTPETFQVKHLHTKLIETPKTTKPTNSVTSTTTKKPVEQMTTTTLKSKVTVTTAKPTKKNLETTTISSTTRTVKPTSTKSVPKLSVTTKATKPKLEKLPYKELKGTNKSDKSYKSTATELKMSAKTPNPNAIDIPEKPSHQTLANVPPTGMQGLFSFLDSSLGSIFKERPSETEKDKELKDATTKLKPMSITTTNSQQTDARVATKLQPINAEDYEDYDDSYFPSITTEYLPRETRQIFDYDQLPESRIGIKNGGNFGAFLERIVDEDDLSSFNLDDEYDEDKNEEEEQDQAAINSKNNKHNFNKRIGASVSSSSTEDDDFDDLSALVDDELTDTEIEGELTDLARS